jgi:hypothetical protein
MLPKLAALYAPILAAQIAAMWPTMPLPSTLGAQVEQETCVSLTSPRCWNPRTELKTDREYGFGLGQLTVTPKFNNFEAAKGWDKSLKNWMWEDRFDPKMQLAALVAYDRNLFNSIKFASTPEDRLQFTFSAYNGGLGGVINDRHVCMATKGCDPGKWFGNVELTSLKARTAVKGYGQSFYQINRGYVRSIWFDRRKRYTFMDTQ